MEKIENAFKEEKGKKREALKQYEFLATMEDKPIYYNPVIIDDFAQEESPGDLVGITDPNILKQAKGLVKQLNKPN